MMSMHTKFIFKKNDNEIKNACITSKMVAPLWKTMFPELNIFNSGNITIFKDEKLSQLICQEKSALGKNIFWFQAKAIVHAVF